MKHIALVLVIPLVLISCTENGQFPSYTADDAIAEQKRIRRALDELQQLLSTLKGSQVGGSAR
jgi:hypothetical protein